jgi:hypothetical protein
MDTSDLSFVVRVTPHINGAAVSPVLRRQFVEGLVKAMNDYRFVGYTRDVRLTVELVEEDS